MLYILLLYKFQKYRNCPRPSFRLPYEKMMLEMRKQNELSIETRTLIIGRHRADKIDSQTAKEVKLNNTTTIVTSKNI